MSADQGVEEPLQRSLAIRIGIALAVLAAVAVVAAMMLGARPAEKSDDAAAVAATQAPLPEAQPKAVDAPSAAVEPSPAQAPSGIGLHADARTASEGSAELAPQSNESQPARASPQLPSGKPQGAGDSGGSVVGKEADGRVPGGAVPTVPSGSDKAGGQSTPAPVDSAQAAALRSPPGAKPPRGPHLQAGVFMQPANAQAFKSNLEAQGLPVYVESRVHIGPFRDRKEAERVREQLREMGVATVLIAQ
jgi:DedD protein